MSIDQRTRAEREADAARIDKEIAQDVATGMAAQRDVAAESAVINAAMADREAARADVYASESAHNALRLDEERRARARAERNGAVAREQASNASMGFWILLGLIGASLLLGLIWYFNRPAPESTAPTTTTIIHQAPAATPAAPQTVVVPVPVPVPAAAAPAPRRAATPPPAIATPVTVNSGVANSVTDPGASPSAPTPVPDAATSNAPGTSAAPLTGYVEKAPSGTGDAIPPANNGTATTNTNNSGGQ